MRALLTASLVLGLATAAMAQTVDLKVGDQAPNFKLQASVDPIEKNTEFAKAKSVTLGQGANQQIVEKKEADFPLLSDPTKDTAKAYGVLNDRGVANRWTFYIDKTGKISYIEKMVKPETSAEDMISKIAELKVPMTHKG